MNIVGILIHILCSISSSLSRKLLPSGAQQRTFLSFLVYDLVEVWRHNKNRRTEKKYKEAKYDERKIKVKKINKLRLSWAMLRPA